MENFARIILGINNTTRKKLRNIISTNCKGCDFIHHYYTHINICKNCGEFVCNSHTDKNHTICIMCTNENKNNIKCLNDGFNYLYNLVDIGCEHIYQTICYECGSLLCEQLANINNISGCTICDECMD